jgi:transposase
MPGLNVVTTAEFAAEAGPMTAYADARAITGRAGLYPSRYQSGPVDRANGRLVPKGNRRLRQAILRIADTLIRCNDHFGLLARTLQLRDMPGPKVHIAVGNRFTRVAYRMVAGGLAYQHPSSIERDYVIKKLIKFYKDHHIDPKDTLEALHVAADHLPAGTRPDEARSLAEDLARVAGKRGAGPHRLGEILPPVLARLTSHGLESTPSGELSPPV